jgi:hypothetical protein
VVGISAVVVLLDMDARAAFATCTMGGLIPQARHGGTFVCVFAVAGSKLEGIGLEKEHIGQTQVAFGPNARGAGAMERDGLSCRAGVAAGEYGDLRSESEACLFAFEYSVILAEDLIKPA